MNSLVVFGPTQVGKSTLVGYLSSYRYTDEEFNKAQIRITKVMRVMGIDLSVKKDMILPSFVSIDRDELMRFPNTDAIGTTKRVHRINAYLPRVENGMISEDKSRDIEILYIDTPGTRTKLSEKYRGIFEAHSGLLLMSVLDLAVIKAEDIRAYPNLNKKEKETIQKYIRPLMFWFATKRDAPFAVAISKVDLDKEFDTNRDEILHKARLIIELAATRVRYSLKDILLVPIGIDLEKDKNNDLYKRIEYNVTIQKEEISLVELLNRLCEESADQGDDSFYFASPERIVRVANTDERAIRQKVISGSVAANEGFSLLPVKVKGRLTEIHGLVKSVRAEMSNNVNTLSQGWIGGVIPKGLRGIDSRDILDLNDIKMLKTSIIVGNNEKCKKGLFLTIRVFLDEIGIDEWLIIEGMLPKEQITMVWFNKPIVVNLLYKITDSLDNFVDLIVMPLSNDVVQSIGYFVLPDGALPDMLSVMIVLHDLEYQKGKLVTTNQYCSGTVIDINDYSGKTFDLKIYDIDGEIDESINENGRVVITQDEIYVEGIAESELGDIYREVRQALKRNDVFQYSSELLYKEDEKYLLVGYSV